MAVADRSGLSRSEMLQFAVIAGLSAIAGLLALVDASPVLVFIASGVAVAGLAHVLGIATEEAGHTAGPRLSALLNATFGNAAEIIIVVLAIREGGTLIDVAKASIIGSVLGNVLLILGFSLLVCGLRHGRTAFDGRTAAVNATMLILATASLGLPTLFAATSGTSRSTEEGVSHGVAIVMLLVYVAYLYWSFTGTNAATAADTAASPARWSTRLALVMLAVSALATGVLSEVLVGAIEPTIEETGISSVFIGLIVVPIVGNVAEHFAAVKISWAGNLDFATGIAYNSALQVALAVSSIAVFAGMIFDHELTLAFTSLEVAVLIAAALIASSIASSGTANWIEGAQLISIYVIAGLIFWYT